MAEVFSGVNINLALVEDGQAFAYRQYLSGCNARKYLDAEVRASRRRYGVWQIPGGITRPWGPPLPLQGDRLLRQGHSYLDSNRDGEACESLR